MAIEAQRNVKSLTPWAGRAALIFLIAAAGVLAAKEDVDPAKAVPATDIRREILSEFKFVPSQAAPAPHKSSLARGPTLPQSQLLGAEIPDIVRMAPYTVHESLKMEELHQDILNSQSEARTDALMSKMGIGLHEAAIGKLHFFTATVFYIPIVVGVGIAW